MRTALLAAFLTLLLSATSLLLKGPSCTDISFIGISGSGPVEITTTLCKVDRTGLYVSNPHNISSETYRGFLNVYNLFVERTGYTGGFALYIPEHVYVTDRSGELPLYLAMWSLIKGIDPPYASGMIEGVNILTPDNLEEKALYVYTLYGKKLVTGNTEESPYVKSYGTVDELDRDVLLNTVNT